MVHTLASHTLMYRLALSIAAIDVAVNNSRDVTHRSQRRHSGIRGDEQRHCGKKKVVTRDRKARLSGQVGAREKSGRDERGAIFGARPKKIRISASARGGTSSFFKPEL